MPHFPYSTKIKKEIHDADPDPGYPKSTRFLPTRPIFVLPTGQSCQISATGHAGHLPLLLFATIWWVDWVNEISLATRTNSPGAVPCSRVIGWSLLILLCSPGARVSAWLLKAGIKSATTTRKGINYKNSGSTYSLERIMDGGKISQIRFEAEITGYLDLIRRLISYCSFWKLPKIR